MKLKVRKFPVGLSIASITAIIVGLFFSFMGISEYYNVAVQDRGSAYTFGMKYQWYYESASIYFSYNLCTGLLFLAALIFVVIGLIRKKRTLTIIGIISISLLFIADRISATIYA